MSKKPWIWSACRSTVSTRSKPAAAISLATSFAVIGTVEALREGTGPDHAADVGGNHHHVLVLLLPDVAEQQRRCVNVVDGDVEEALDLVRVQVHREHAVEARGGDQLGDELRGDRHARGTRPPVLARIAEVRDDGRDARRGGAPARIRHHEKLHQVLVGGRAGRLDDERLAAADVLEDLDVDLAVAEAPDVRLREWHAQYPGDVVRELGMRIAGEDRHRRQVHWLTSFPGHSIQARTWLGWQDS